MAKMTDEELQQLNKERMSLRLFNPDIKTITVDALNKLATKEEEAALADGYIREDKYYCTHSFQRKVGQWGKKEKSLLIDSMMRGIQLTDFIVIEEEEEDINGEMKKVHYIIDGIQRINIINDFLHGNFKLEKGTVPECMEGYSVPQNEDEYTDFDTRFIDHIKYYTIVKGDYSGKSQDEIREIFLRTNGGKPLNTSQKEVTKLDATVKNKVNSLREIEVEKYSDSEEKCVFWDKTAITVLNCARDVDRDLLMQTLYVMYLMKHNITEEKDIKDYNTKFLYNEFGNILAEKIPAAEFDDMISSLKAAIEKLGKLLPYGKIPNYTKIKKTALPYVLAELSRIIKAKKNTTDFAVNVHKFCLSYATNTEFKSKVEGGTSSAKSISKRLKYFKKYLSQSVTEDEKKAWSDSLKKPVKTKEVKEEKKDLNKVVD